MNYIVLSDIHLEFGYYKVPEFPPETIVILAGDIHVGMRAEEFIVDLCKRFAHVIYVPGNHEFYRHTLEEVNAFWKDVEITNFHYLYNDKILLDGTVILGTTLWTDVGDMDWFTVRNLKQNMTDFRVIKEFGIEGWKREHDIAKKFLEDNIEDGCMVVTHFMPHERCITERFRGDRLNPGFVTTDLDHLFDGRVRAWIYGHTHEYNNFNIRGTELICNPRGYCGYEPTRDYIPFEFKTDRTWW